jgi:hypothetical protein
MSFSVIVWQSETDQILFDKGLVNKAEINYLFCH